MTRAEWSGEAPETDPGVILGYPGSRREAGVGGNVLDPQEAGFGGCFGRRLHRAILANLTVCVNVSVRSRAARSVTAAGGTP